MSPSLTQNAAKRGSLWYACMKGSILHFVVVFKSSMFVMENVPGIHSAGGGSFFYRFKLKRVNWN